MNIISDNECIIDVFEIKTGDHTIFYTTDENDNEYWTCECNNNKKFTKEEEKYFESKKETLETKVEYFVMDLELNYNHGQMLVDKIIKKCIKNNNSSIKYIESFVMKKKNKNKKKDMEPDEYEDEIILKRKNSGDLKNKNKRHKKEMKIKKNTTYILFVTNEDEADPRIYKFNAYNEYLKKSMETLVDLYEKNISLHVDTWNVLFFISDYLSDNYKISKELIQKNFYDEEMIRKVFEVLPNNLLDSLSLTGVHFIKHLEVKDIKKYSKKKTLVAILTEYC